MSQSSIAEPNPNQPQSSTANVSGHNSSSFTSTIPVNKGGHSYTLPETFEVWEANKLAILSTEYPNYQQNNSEDSQAYKLASAQPIYHLSMNSKPQASDIESRMLNLTLNGATPKSGTNPASLHVDPSNFSSSSLDTTEKSKIDPQPTNGLSETPLATVEQPYLQSNQIKWCYLDSSGNEQGPFDGDLMQNWFQDGYLSMDLQVKRQNSEYQSLHLFCVSVLNFVAPFKVPLPVQVLQLQQAPLNGLLLNQFSQPLGQVYQPFQMNSMPLILQQQVPVNSGLMNAAPSNSVLSRTNSNWGIGEYSSPGTPSSNISQLPIQNIPLSINSMNINTNIPLNGQSTLAVQPTPMSPWSSTVQTQSRVNSPFVGDSSDQVLSKIHSSVVTDILGDFDKDKTGSEISEPVTEYEPIVQPNVVVPEEIVQPKVVVPDEIVQPRVVVPEDITPEQPLVSAPSAPEPVIPQAEAVESPKTETLIPATAAKDSKAPWAAVNKPETPKMSLKEIQKLEAEKLAKQKKLELEMKFEAQSKLLKEEMLKQEKEKAAKSALSSVTGWGNTTLSVPRKKLSEIQEEERKEAELAKLKQKTPLNTIASTIARPEDGGAWSTVTSKKVVKKASTPTLNRSITGSSNTNPQLLRSVSSSVMPSRVDNSKALREEFIVWARSQMTNLYPSVSPNDLLEMFISLPNSQDSILLISETVYSSSATMNGRVFAQEFLKKRQQTERQLTNANDLNAWSQAIIDSADKVPSVDEEGWSTTNKKKKGRKNQG